MDNLTKGPERDLANFSLVLAILRLSSTRELSFELFQGVQEIQKNREKTFFDGLKWYRHNVILLRCSESQSGRKQARVNGRTVHDNAISRTVLCMSKWREIQGQTRVNGCAVLCCCAVLLCCGVLCCVAVGCVCGAAR